MNTASCCLFTGALVAGFLSFSAESPGKSTTVENPVTVPSHPFLLSQPELSGWRGHQLILYEKMRPHCLPRAPKEHFGSVVVKSEVLVLGGKVSEPIWARLAER